jgi:serine/threonine protein phosphatase PrpC
LLYLRADEAYWTHVGDSRIYHWRDGALLHRTRDHTAAELLRYAAGGSATPEVMGHELYMCLGGRNSLEPDFDSSDVRGGDLFLVCSDGFWKCMESEGLVSGLSAGIASDTAAGLVARAAASAGDSGDNISIALAYREGSGAGGLLGRVKNWFGN